MRMRPIVFVAAVAALALPGVSVHASGSGSINRLKTLNAARDKVIAQQNAETKAAEADLQQRIAAAKKDSTAARRAAVVAARNIPGSGPISDRRTVAAIDDAYQMAVKTNDFTVMDRILGDDVAVVLGDGRTVSRAELLSEAQSQTVRYEQQGEVPGTRSIRVWNDVAVVTALLWVKGMGVQGFFDDHLWFSATYIREGRGWRYAFGQISMPLTLDQITAQVPQSAQTGASQQSATASDSTFLSGLENMQAQGQSGTTSAQDARAARKAARKAQRTQPN